MCKVAYSNHDGALKYLFIQLKQFIELWFLNKSDLTEILHFSKEKNDDIFLVF